MVQQEGTELKPAIRFFETEALEGKRVAQPSFADEETVTVKPYLQCRTRAECQRWDKDWCR
jgi:hypothetical protein